MMSMASYEHGGNIHKMRRIQGDDCQTIYDFSANINPLGPPEWLRSVVSRLLEQLVHYPDPENVSFATAAARYHDLSPEHVVCGNGTTELLYALLQQSSATRVVLPVPSYVDYQRAARLARRPIETLVLREAENFDLDMDELAGIIREKDLVILATPNNPTGRLVDRRRIIELASAHPGASFLVDEAFLDFVEGGTTVGGVCDNLVTLNSMTKFYGLPGLRLGYAILPPEHADSLRQSLPPWTVNTLAQVVGERCLLDRQYQQESRLLCRRLREQFVDDLAAIPGLHVFPGSANYLLVKLAGDKSGADLTRYCLDRAIMIRCCDNYQGFDSAQFVRIAVRTEQENQRFLEVLGEYMKTPVVRRRGRKKTPAIMFQGTCSDAGKSIMTAAFCRILRQDGVRVAPFKAQNMSLNSFVTLQGDEMGRAQVVQAQACGIDPDSRMNPILLKPNSDTGSQIIVRGKPVGNMSVGDYNTYKPQAWQAVCASYESLATEFEALVLEGAGSPGEVNLKADDIVNMKMAAYAEAPVILVGDIDRGGVYASFVGTMEVLANWERELVKGFLVNKFRGQADLLHSAHLYVKEHTGREVFGVVPYLSALGLPEEDSVSFKKGSFNRYRNGESVDIAVINLPHISNFTDLEPFLEEPDVNLRIVDCPEDIGAPQAILIPGSKNVIHDLRYLLAKGFDRVIKGAVERGCELVGICGGYQMLGSSIEDPYRIESDGGAIDGLGFLTMKTIIEKEKNLLRRQGIHDPSGKEVTGYEIHHGLSTQPIHPLFMFADGAGCGLANPSGRVWGAYLHGMFDSDMFRRWFIDKLRIAAGLPALGRVVAPYDLDRAFDTLASTVRQAVDMDRVYQLLGL